MSEYLSTPSWLNHCLSIDSYIIEDGHSIIRNVYIWHYGCSSHHFPISIDVVIACVPEVENVRGNGSNN